MIASFGTSTSVTTPSPLIVPATRPATRIVPDPSGVEPASDSHAIILPPVATEPPGWYTLPCTVVVSMAAHATAGQSSNASAVNSRLTMSLLPEDGRACCSRRRPRTPSLPSP